MEQPNRRGDWNQRVDETLLTLTTSQRVNDQIIEDLEIKLADISRQLFGDESEDIHGLVERLHEMDRVVAALKAIVLPDQTGKGGFAWRLDALEDRRQERIEARSYRWKFYGIVVFALILLVREVVHDLPQFEVWWNRPTQDTLQKKIDKAKRPRGKKIFNVRVIHKKQAQEGGDESPSEDLPALLDGDGGGAH